MDKLFNKLGEARELAERLEMLGSAPPIGLELEAREFELRRRILASQLACLLGEACVEALKLVRF